MAPRLRTLGRAALAAVEVGLALVVLGSVAMLLELRAAYAAGASGEGTFAVGFLMLWVAAGGSLILLVGAHVVVSAAWTADSEDLGALTVRLRRPAVELVGSAVVTLALLPEALAGNPYLAALAASATLALATLVHVAVAAALGLRGLVAG